MVADRLKVAIFGAGSIGCYVGGQLASAGIAVRFIGRERFQTALQQQGLSLTHYERSPIQVDADDFEFDLNSAALGDADIVLVTVKSQDSAVAGADLNAVVRPGTLVVSLQNGTRNPATLREVMPNATVLGGMVPFNVTSTAAGQFHCGTEGHIVIESVEDDRLMQLQRAFESAGQGCDLVENIEAVQWGKLLVNLNNAMNTLYGGTLKSGLVQRDYRRALALMIEEALAIVRRAGIEPEKFGNASAEKMIRVLRLPNFIYKILMNLIVKIDAAARSSMLDDLESGRPPEIDYLQGEIVRLAESLGQDAPISRVVAARVREAFAARRSPKLQGPELLALVSSSSE